MKILLDECVPSRFAELLRGHDVSHVTALGWAGVKNGELISRASTQFDVLISVDYKLPSQLVSDSLTIPVIVLHGSSNKLKHIKHLIPDLLKLFEEPLKNKTYRLGA